MQYTMPHVPQLHSSRHWANGLDCRQNVIMADPKAVVEFMESTVGDTDDGRICTEDMSTNSAGG